MFDQLLISVFLKFNNLCVKAQSIFKACTKQIKMLLKRSPLIIFFVIIVTKSCFTKLSNEEIPTYKCQVSNERSRCDLTGIQVTKKQPFFKIAVDNTAKITEIFVTQSTIPVLTKSICDTFPSLIRLYVDGANIKFVRKNAFEKCTEILEINLANNKVKKLQPETFTTNLKLNTLSLDKNLLSELPNQIFDTLVDLQFLHLQNNLLKEFKADLLVKNENLQRLYIFSNYLTDLDIETLHSKLPHLKAVHANNNDFPCKRVHALTLYAEVR